MRFYVRRPRGVRPGLAASVLARFTPAFVRTLLLGLTATVLGAAPAGPTLRLNDGRAGAGENAVADFMYFVPLISPEPVSVGADSSAEHRVRLLSTMRRVKFESFLVKSEFEFVGAGHQQNLIACTNAIQRHEAKLKRGGKLERVLSAINVQGPGKGTIEIEGVISNGLQTVNEVRLRFNAHGQISPVSIALHDLDYRDSDYRSFNEILARVNTLTFHRTPGRPKMEVTVASVKSKNAKDNLWQNLKGGQRPGREPAHPAVGGGSARPRSHVGIWRRPRRAGGDIYLPPGDQFSVLPRAGPLTPLPEILTSSPGPF